MNRAGTNFEPTWEPAWTPTGRADTWMRATVTVTVAGLAGIAGHVWYATFPPSTSQAGHRRDP